MSDWNLFENSKQSIKDSDLDRLEELVGHKLPSEFRSHYLVFNGGEPEKSFYLVDGSPLVVQEFFSITHGESAQTVEDNYRDLVEVDKIIPNHLLPFGRDPGGDFYCLNMRDGSVSVFRAEYLPKVDDCVTEIADSFGAFLEGLVEDV